MLELNSKDIDKIGESELAYKIRRSIRFDSKTPTQIAKELNTSSQSINNYLKHLLELDIVRKVNSDGRSQPYTVSPTTGFTSLFWHYWETKIENNTTFSSYEDILEQMSKHLDEKELLEKEEINSELDNFLMNYTINYFKENEDSTIKKMLVDDFWNKIIAYQFSASFRNPDIEETTPEYFKTLLTIILASNIKQTPYEIENAVKETFG